MARKIDLAEYFVHSDQHAGQLGRFSLLQFHYHDWLSVDSHVSTQQVIRALVTAGIDWGAITNHDVVEQLCQPDLHPTGPHTSRLQLIPSSVELTTRFHQKKNDPWVYPHFLLLNAEASQLSELVGYDISLSIRETFPTLLRTLLYLIQVYRYAPPLEALLEWLQDYPEILLIAAHPIKSRKKKGNGFDSSWTTSLSLRELEWLQEKYHRFDGMEVMNYAPRIKLDSWRLWMALRLGLIPFGTMDAHCCEDPLGVFTFLPGKFESVTALFAALRNNRDKVRVGYKGEKVIEGKLNPKRRHRPE